MSVVQSVLFNPAIPKQDRQDAINRIHADPGIPTPNPTSSFWLRTPHPTLSQTQSKQLPPEADVVIIGSGITAASIARTLLKESSKPDQGSSKPAVAIIEARDICSGATGRNGGHILATAEDFVDLEEAFGLDVAKKVTRFRLAHLAEVLKVAAEEDLTEESQARKVQSLTVCFDESVWRGLVHCITRFKECMPDEAKEWKILEKDEIPKEFCLPSARGIIALPAGAIWPYKFVTGLLARLKQEFPQDLVIETNTPVMEVRRDATTTAAAAAIDLPYSVVTSRGTIKARHVIHCTNAHVGHLVPGLRGRIFPIRGQMSAQNPGQDFACQGEQHSWTFVYERGFDYLTQLPDGGQAGTSAKMMFGGGFAQGEAGGVADLGISTDSELSLYADIHLSGALSAIFGRENWGSVSGPGVEQMWTGNMSYTFDGLPWVGKLPDLATQRGPVHPGQGAEWISSACCGEGMVQTWLSGKALGRMLLIHDNRLSGPQDLSWFPDEMLVTEERIQKAH
ncbi:hypothetical protein FE257_010999 [Aspergillus nanangensis]|uniref:FAD dependent oxidoreductase domain-containing protein n=1 Tax=Aspergillus nanangensis TaxID=2582783 RepID=A0AAD4CI25_ASPNN|nr:hypothetical protein FE257_010999 [Aspergillus nanangensis]